MSEQVKSSVQALHAEIARLNKIILELTGRVERQERGVASPESESLFRQMFERHTAVMLLIDPESRTIVDANAAAANFYGFPLERLRGMSVSCINAQPEAEISPLRQQAIKGEKNSFVFDHRLADGDVRSVEVHISTVDYRDRTLFFSIIHDITERKQAEEQIRNLAFYDPLTKLPNRRLLNDRLRQAMSASKRNGRYAALMLLDLDNFKPLNDLHGHAVGDMLLMEVAARLKSCVRDMDTLARFGGDEFVVILGQLEADKDESIVQARIIAEKIRTRLNEPYILAVKLDGAEDNSVEYHCTSSIGVVVFFDQEACEDALLKWADAAMYQAKDSGGNQIRFHDEDPGTSDSPTPSEKL